MLDDVRKHKLYYPSLHLPRYSKADSYLFFTASSQFSKGRERDRVHVEMRTKLSFACLCRLVRHLSITCRAPVLSAPRESTHLAFLEQFLASWRRSSHSFCFFLSSSKSCLSLSLGKVSTHPYIYACSSSTKSARNKRSLVPTLHEYRYGHLDVGLPRLRPSICLYLGA